MGLDAFDEKNKINQSNLNNLDDFSN